MALRKITKEQVAKDEIKGTLFHVDNGDLQALDQITKKWKFKDEESALRFALALMKQNEGNTIYITRPDGAKIGLQPSDELLK